MAQGRTKNSHSSKTIRHKVMQVIKVKVFKGRHLKLEAAVLLAALLVGGITTVTVRAETYPGGADNGLTSRILSLSNSLTALGYGSTTNTPDWGALWNRIATSAEWVPSGSVVAKDVKNGDTFYNGSRSLQTGTGSLGGPCPSDNYVDGNGTPVTPATNCSLTWTTASPAVTGDDKQDPFTGLIWSDELVTYGGTPYFSSDDYQQNLSWAATAGYNYNMSASQLCSGINGGGVWRLPTQKELMQAYIDGSYFNLTSVASQDYYWGATLAGSSYAVEVNLNNGMLQENYITNQQASIRCVR
jgi:hypothetical protein